MPIFELFFSSDSLLCGVARFEIDEPLYFVFLGETSSVLLGSVLKISPLKVARNTDIQRTASF